jgi:hypothetical protein
VAIPRSLCDREQDKFCEDTNGDTAVRTCTEITSQPDLDINIKAPTGPFRVTTLTVGLAAADPLGGSALAARTFLAIRNKSATETVYLGQTAGVTADDTATGGWEIGPSEDFNIDLDNTNVFYLISTAASVPVKILEVAST